MGMFASGYILQDKVDKLLGYIEGVKTYINDIAILSKGCFKKNIEHMSINFGRLSASGLKVNTPKCSFGLTYITYIGYVITRGGYKTRPEKLQGIMDTGKTATTIEAQALICMVQYYRDMWTRRSHILSPLT